MGPSASVGPVATLGSRSLAVPENLNLRSGASLGSCLSKRCTGVRSCASNRDADAGRSFASNRDAEACRSRASMCEPGVGRSSSPNADAEPARSFNASCVFAAEASVGLAVSGVDLRLRTTSRSASSVFSLRERRFHC